MANILDLLTTDTGQTLVKGASAKTGQPEDKITQVLSMALPVLLGAMKRNASTTEGAKSLDNALADNRHDGSLLDQIGNLVNNKQVDNSLLSEGAGILGHVLGNRQDRVEQNISRTSGVDASSVSQIIKMAAPILMAFLGSQKRKDNVGQDGLEGLLGSVLGTNQKHDTSLIETLLDADGDGSIIDDVAGMVLGNKGQKKGGLGGMLGGFFGNK